MKKKAIAVLVTGVMVMASMTACGADTKEAEPVAAMTEEAAEEPVEETAEEPAADETAEETTEEATEEATEKAAETENEATEEAAEEETAEEEETVANDIYEGLEYDAEADAYYYTVVDSDGETCNCIPIPAGLKDGRIASLENSEKVEIVDTLYVYNEYPGKTWYGADILAVDCIMYPDGSKKIEFVVEDNGSLIYGDGCPNMTDEEISSIFDTDSNMIAFTDPTEGDSAETAYYWMAGINL